MSYVGACMCREVKKINSGKPSLDPWEKVQLTEIGVEEEAPKEAF
jgi:hypothetical protein